MHVKPPLLRVRLDTLTSVISDTDTSEDEENGVGPLDANALSVSIYFLSLVPDPSSRAKKKIQKRRRKGLGKWPTLWRSAGISISTR